MNGSLLGILTLLWIGAYYWSELIPLTFIMLGFYSLRGASQVIQSFSIISLLQLINPGIAVISMNGLKWLVIILPFLWIIMHIFDWSSKKTNLFSLANTHLIFSFLLLPLCLISSFNPIISTFKLLSFAAGGFTIIKSFELSEFTQEYWHSWFNTMFVFILLGSLFVFLTPYGYFKNERGFQGIFNHPQVLGVMAGLSSIWFFSQQKTLVKYASGGVALVLVFLTKARTGLILMVISALLLIFIQSILDKKIRINAAVKTLLLFIIIIGVPTFLLLEDSTDLLVKFILKRTPESGIIDSFGESRGQLITKSLNNFYQYPLTGIGLGINSDFNFFNSQFSEVLGVPFSAPTEKGFMPTAILEELGIFGGLLTISYLSIMSINNPLGNSNNYAWLFLASLCINLGEFIFFSFGGLGLFQWILIAFCCTPEK